MNLCVGIGFQAYTVSEEEKRRGNATLMYITYISIGIIICKKITIHLRLFLYLPINRFHFALVLTFQFFQIASLRQYIYIQLQYAIVPLRRGLGLVDPVS